MGIAWPPLLGRAMLNHRHSLLIQSHVHDFNQVNSSETTKDDAKSPRECTKSINTLINDFSPNAKQFDFKVSKVAEAGLQDERTPSQKQMSGEISTVKFKIGQKKEWVMSPDRWPNTGSELHFTLQTGAPVAKLKFSDQTAEVRAKSLKPTTQVAPKVIDKAPLVDESDSDVVDDLDDPLQPECAKRKSFSPAVKRFLIRWLLRHQTNPYPTQRLKSRLADKTGLAINQVEDFLVNGSYVLTKVGDVI
jgi:Homeobox KN domain